MDTSLVAEAAELWWGNSWTGLWVAKDGRFEPQGHGEGCREAAVPHQGGREVGSRAQHWEEPPGFKVQGPFQRK